MTRALGSKSDTSTKGIAALPPSEGETGAGLRGASTPIAGVGARSASPSQARRPHAA